MNNQVVIVSSEAPCPPDSGGKKRVLRLIEAISRAGGDPYLLVHKQVGESEREELEANGIQVECAGPTSQGSFRQRLGYHVRGLPGPVFQSMHDRLAELSRESAFVQTEFTESALYSRSIAQGTPWVLSLHNFDSQHAQSIAQSSPLLSMSRIRAVVRRNAMARLEKKYVSAADAVLAVSAGDADGFTRLGGSVTLVPNGTDAELMSLPIGGGSDVLFLGKLDYAPNAHGLLRFLEDGWPQVSGLMPSVRLRIVGSGSGHELERAVQENSNVDLVGRVEDVRDEFQRAAASVVPIWQGGGTRIKALEALASGRPVVGTPLGLSGIGIESGRQALLGDSPEELARQLVTVLTDKDRAEALAREARLLAESMRWEQTTHPAEALYRELLTFRRSDVTPVQRDTAQLGESIG